MWHGVARGRIVSHRLGHGRRGDGLGEPLAAAAFATLVKTASEVLRRHEQQQRAMLHKSLTVSDASGARVRVALQIIPDEDDPHAWLTATDEAGAELARVRVAANFKLAPATAAAWIEGAFRQP